MKHNALCFVIYFVTAAIFWLGVLVGDSWARRRRTEISGMLAAVLGLAPLLAALIALCVLFAEIFNS